MAEEIKLYDIQLDTHPSNHGDIFRTIQVFECPVCGALTNRVLMGGGLVQGIRVICPNAQDCWHHTIEAKQRRLYTTQSQIDELEEEIERLKTEHAPKIKNDLEGAPDRKLKKIVTNTFDLPEKGPSCGHSLWRPM